MDGEKKEKKSYETVRRRFPFTLNLLSKNLVLTARGCSMLTLLYAPMGRFCYLRKC